MGSYFKIIKNLVKMGSDPGDFIKNKNSVKMGSDFIKSVVS